MFTCSKCHRSAFLVHGLCRQCAPDLHSQTTDWAPYNALCDQYERETGTRAVDDWEGFDDWCRVRERDIVP